MSRIEEAKAKNRALWADVSWEEMAAFIGPHAEGYRKVFDQHKVSMAEKGLAPFAFNWSWPALIPFLGIPWAAARRQWVFVAIMVGAMVLINVLGLMMETVGSSFGFLPFLAAFMARPFYVQQAVTKIHQIKTQFEPGPGRDTAIAGAGGLNMTYGYIAGAICIGLLALAILAMVVSGGV
jgi:hypothetical protein